MSSVHRRRVLISRAESAISVNKWEGPWTVTVVELPSLPIPPSMWRPPMIMAVIGVKITATGKAVSDTILVLEYVLVKWVAGCVDIPMCYRLSPKWMPNGCFNKNDAIVFWTTAYATNAWMTKTTRLLKAKAWIGSPIIAVNAEPSNASLNKLSPTENGRNPWCTPTTNRTPCGLGIPCPRININTAFLFHRRCRWPFTREAPKAWIHMWNIYLTSMVIRVWYSSHPVTLEPSPSRPWPSPTWTPPCLLSLGTHFI